MSSEFMTDAWIHSEAGYFGKVPSHGDFVTRKLPQSFIKPWDTWLQEAIAISRQQLGGQWLEYYLTSPMYRFTLSPGICGPSAWLGVLIPSVDRVGRYYPMTLSAATDPHSTPFIDLQRHNDWFVQIEELALTCLQDHFDLDHFNNRLSRLTLGMMNCRQRDACPSERLEGDRCDHAWQRPMERVEAITHLLPFLLDDLLKEFCFAYSVWWTQGSEQVAPSLLVCEGLPPSSGMAALLDGNWQQWGWEGRRFPLPSCG